MRSLWRLMAANWLGWQASDALVGKSALDELMLPTEVHPPAFLVRRCSEVSHHAIMSDPARDHPGSEMAIDEVLAAAILNPEI